MRNTAACTVLADGPHLGVGGRREQASGRSDGQRSRNASPSQVPAFIALAKAAGSTTDHVASKPTPMSAAACSSRLAAPLQRTDSSKTSAQQRDAEWLRDSRRVGPVRRDV